MSPHETPKPFKAGLTSSGNPGLLTGLNTQYSEHFSKIVTFATIAPRGHARLTQRKSHSAKRWPCPQEWDGEIFSTFTWSIFSNASWHQKVCNVRAVKGLVLSQPSPIIITWNLETKYIHFFIPASHIVEQIKSSLRAFSRASDWVSQCYSTMWNTDAVINVTLI